jgi:O-antigen ligase
MSNSNTKATPWYFQVIVVLYALHTTLPIFGYYIPTILHVAALLFLYAFLFLKESQTFLSVFAKIIPIFAISILSIIYTGFKNFAIDVYWLLQMMIYPLLSLYLIRTADQRVVRRIVVVLGISFIVTSITTYFGCRAYPSASRDLAAMLSSRDPALYALYMSRNIGSFSFIYALVLLIPIIVFAIKDKLIKRWIGLIVLVVMSMAIIYSDYTTALLFMVISIAILFVFPKKLETKHFVILSIVILFVFLVGSSLIVAFLGKLGEVVGSEVVSDRLEELSSYTENSSDYLEGDIEARSDFYMKSINSFLESPIWGSSTARLGGHSFVFDNLGQFGLIGLVAMLLMFRAIYKHFFVPFRPQKWYGHVLFSFFVAIALAFLNPKDYINVLTFYLPLFCVAYSEDLEEEPEIENENTLDCQ